MSGGSGGCEPRIEVIVKLKKRRWGSGSGGGYGRGSGQGSGVGRGSADVNQELKISFKVHKGIVQLIIIIKIIKRGRVCSMNPQPSQVIANEIKMKRKKEKKCAPCGV